MPRGTPENREGRYSSRRDRDDYKYSMPHHYVAHRDRERYCKDSSSDQTYNKRSRSRSTSRSRYLTKLKRRSGSRSRSRYNYHSDRRSKSKSYSSRRRSRSRSRSRSYSRQSRRSESNHYGRSNERSEKKSDNSLKHYNESSNYNEQSKIDNNRTMNYNGQRNEMYSVEDVNNVEENYRNNYDDEYDNEYDSDRNYSGNDIDIEPSEKEKIHREIEKKLRETLAKEGKIYPPRKTEASHPVFANDGSFLEVFKKMQAQVDKNIENQEGEKNNTAIPIISKRRGGRILKTGVVAKPTARNSNSSDPKDFWSLYLEEVKKYKNATCDIDGKTRPLVK